MDVVFGCPTVNEQSNWYGACSRQDKSIVESMLWLEFQTFCFASLQDEICALACDRKPQQHANTNAQVCKTDHARRKLVNVLKNKSDGGEEEV